MRADLQIRPLAPERDARGAAAVALQAFGASVAPHYSAEGRRTFHKYAGPDFLAFRLMRGETGFVAVLPGRDETVPEPATAVPTEPAGECIVGMAVLRGHDHLSMLFVHPAHQGQGIGRALLDAVVRHVKGVAPDVTQLTVNASPNAHGTYLRYGFVDAGPEVEEQGIRSTPMTLRL